ncbi:hypothetical protein SAMN05216410_0725 [Sanguibacter gelidistatuariae]|uniref:DUF2255 family protein n=1 Tax=Sanguibacter gelidistatuariae TaxID=1814289 RepID=A0A1G6H4F1_9MICO|nr:DUF2255 family protein [Sanguibacter gelidistatuariae]SDB89169.1 hypothetical protein SAMN05216410_0725 [Sanguibacter gelidistatuariae]
MPSWTKEELSKIGLAEELQVSTLRPDGTFHPPVTIWVVRAGDDLYIRSAHGRGNGWFRYALADPRGRIQAGGVEKDVAFVEPDDDIHPALDTAYRTKYDNQPPAYVAPVTDATSATATFRLDPRDA